MGFANIKEIAIAAVQAATAVSDTETLMGSEINVKDYDRMIIWMDYTIGTETGVLVVPKFLFASGGAEHPLMKWSTAADQTRTAQRYELSATIKAYIILDISGAAAVKLYQLKKGGTVTGTIKVDYSLLRQGMK